MKKNLLLLFSSLSISFAVAEIICRVKGNYLSYNERTGAGAYTSPFEPTDRGHTHRYKAFEKQLVTRNEFTDSWTANEDGLKDQNISPIKRGKRILVIGDSFTEGVGAPPESSYPRILQTLLDSNVQVINAGIGGSDIFFEYKLLQAVHAKYKPDAVIVTCNPSDIVEYMVRDGFERFLPNDKVSYRKAPWFEPFYAHSLLVRLLVHDVFHYDFNFIRQKDYSAELAKAEAGMCSAIDSLQSFCNTNNIWLGVLFHPFYGDVQHPELYTMQPLIAYCSQKNIPNSDALPFLFKNGISAQNWQGIYWPGDGHFNSKGYEMMANCSFELLKNKVW
ncbi:MAG: hypothetical protein V4615_17715 [Bacteroidota bacterium]